MKNELYIEKGWMYWKTNKDNADDALDELFEACNKAGIELIVEKRVLRDADGNDIDD